MAGTVDISVEAEPGRVVTLDHCEVLDDRGNFLRNILGRNKDQRDVLVCGSGTTRFHPRFTYHGFRYLRLEGVNKDQVRRISARAMGSRLESRGSFACSDPRINRLQENIRQSTRSNMFSVPTDCPQREKAGWTGDILVFAPTGCFNYHLAPFLEAWLANMRLEQGRDGAIPVVIPDPPAQKALQSAMGNNWSTGWSDACVMLPWALYQAYGDSRVLLDNLDMMDRWIAFVESACRRKPDDWDRRSAEEQRWNDVLPNAGFHFGDWFIPSYVPRPDGVFAASRDTKDVVAACFHALVLETYVAALEVLIPDQPDSRDLVSRKDMALDRLIRVRRAIRDCYVDRRGWVRGDLQGLYVLVLKSGALGRNSTVATVSRLAQLIRDNGNRLDTGFVSTPFLLDVLSDHGHADLARSLLFQSDAPSWLYMVERGATSIWDNWEAVRPDGEVTTSSFNHYALGAVGDFLYRRIGGISAAEPGYKRIRFAPDLHCGLEWAEARLDSRFGEILCHWERDEDSFRIDVEVPRGCCGEFLFDGKQQSLPQGLSRLTISDRMENEETKHDL